MAQNRELVSTSRKSIKNAIVKLSANGGKKNYMRLALPTFDPKTGAINKTIQDLQNVFIEGNTHEADDALTGTYSFGLRFYSKESDGTTDRAEPFYRWELLEEIDIQSEREEAMFTAKLAVQKNSAKLALKAGTPVEAGTEITDKW